MCAKRNVKDLRRDPQPRSQIGPRLPPDIPVKDWGHMLHAHARYISAFQSTTEFQSRIPRTEVPGNTDEVAYMIQAPLNSVEILEAILKPERSFQVHTAHHVPHTPPNASDQRYQKMKHRLPRHKALYREYRRFQGQLEKDREVSFVCIPRSSVRKLWDFYWSKGFSVTRAFYICIPWYCGFEKRICHPWITVQRLGPGLGVSIPPQCTYEAQLRELLRTLGIPEDFTFDRSLLRPGEEPLPETLLDWFRGIPGTTRALPYYRNKDDKMVNHRPDGLSAGMNSMSLTENHSKGEAPERSWVMQGRE